MDSTRIARTGPQAAGLLAAFAGSIAMSMFLSRDGDAGSAIWTANGFLVGALLILPRPWAAAVLAASIAVQAGLGMVAGHPPARTIVLTLVNGGQCLFAAWLTQRYCGIHARRLGLVRLTRILVFAVLPSAVIGGLAAAIIGLAFPHRLFVPVWRDWAVSGGLGMALVLPGLLLAARFGQYRDFRRSGVETAGLFAGLAALTLAVFLQSELPLFFVVFPAVTLIAFRLGPPGAALAGLLVGAVALPLTLLGDGPAALARVLDFPAQVRLAEAFVAAVLITGVATASALADQNRLRRLLIWRDRSARASRQRAQEAERIAALVGVRGGGKARGGDLA
ncbi:MAG: MASE1 domain-containing protein [Proteobacteria bacterium]|nr:MASE1 domain-containing protein [Pseudomonadota bacterium]